MKRIIDGISKNLMWKLISVILAFAFWFTIMNIEDPSIIRSYGTNFEIRNNNELEQYGYILLNEDTVKKTNVKVSFRATDSNMSELSKEVNGLYTYIDLDPQDVNYGNNIGMPLKIDVKVQMPADINESNYKIASINPSKIEIILDKVDSLEKKVDVKLLGNVADGYTSTKTILSPDHVTLTGPSTILETVGSVQINLNISNAKTNITGNDKPIVLDKSGNDITSKVRISDNNISAVVQVNKVGSVKIEPTISGAVATGYTIVNVTTDPEFVELVGKEDEVAKYNKISLDPVNVTGLTTTTEFKDDLNKYLEDSNIHIKQESNNTANIKVVIEKEITRTINIPVNRLNITGLEPNYQLPSVVKVTVLGRESLVNNLRSSDFSGSIDLSNLDVGTYVRDITFNIPNGVTEVGQDGVITVIVENVETPVPAEIIEPSPKATNSKNATETDSSSTDNINNTEDVVETEKLIETEIIKETENIQKSETPKPTGTDLIEENITSKTLATPSQKPNETDKTENTATPSKLDNN